MSKTTLRDTILNVDTVYDMGGRKTGQFLPPNFYIDRLEAAINSYISEIIGEDETEPQHTGDNIDAHKMWNTKRRLRAEQRRRAGLTAEDKA